MCGSYFYHVKINYDIAVFFLHRYYFIVKLTLQHSVKDVQLCEKTMVKWILFNIFTINFDFDGQITSFKK